MSSISAHMKATLSSPLLADNDNDTVSAASAANMSASHLRELGFPGESIPAVFANPWNPESASCLFVRSGNKGQGSRGASSTSGNFFGKTPGDDSHRSGQVKHIDASSPPNLATADFPLKRRVRPVLFIDWDNVGVSQKGESFATGIRSGNRDD